MTKKIGKGGRPVSLLLWIFGGAVIVFLLYVIIGAVVPYYMQRSIGEEDLTEIDHTAFYGDSESCDRVALVEVPIESLGTRVHLIDEAKDTIDISYYAIHEGETTDIFLGTILKAADRGVKVRILVDGMFGGLTYSHKNLAVALGGHPNVEVKVYNPFTLLKPWRINARLHDKYIIIDNRILLLGGRNIGDKYFGPEGFSSNLSIDRDVLIYNTNWENPLNTESVLFKVREYMQRLWDSDYVKQPFESDTDKGKAIRAHLYDVADDIEKKYPRLFDHTQDDYMGWTFATNKITFLSNDIEPLPKKPKVFLALSSLLSNAERKVTLQSPYIVLDKNIYGLLERLGSKNIEYKILTNSKSSSPNFPAYSAYLGDRKKILGTGAEIYEYQSNHAIHAKTYLIDDRMAVVGSFNMDPRSAYIDTELMLAIDSPDFTEYIGNVQDMYIKGSLKADENGNYETGGDVKPVETEKSKNIIFKIASVLVKPFKFLV